MTLDENIKNITKEYIGNLQELEKFEGDILDTIPPIIKLMEDMFKQLKTFISDYTFKDEDEEIRFFKEIKPQLFSKLIYYQKIYKIEAMRPNASDAMQKKYFEKQLDKLKDFFDQNLDFYKYYRSGGTHFDKHCFVRGKPFIHPNLESFYFERDPKFSSHCDFKVAKLLANELLRIYLNTELQKLEEPKHPADEPPKFPKTKETWTRSKTDLAELIYAICETDCFNYGKINLKRLTDYFENVFNIDLGNIYHTYVEMKSRANRTQFLDELRDRLNKRMEDDDQKG